MISFIFKFVIIHSLQYQERCQMHIDCECRIGYISYQVCRIRFIIIMFVDSQNKIYYKGNPYTRQNYIPKSALKNRSKPSYLVQLPQGQHFFGSSRKKQYVDAHNDSEIKKTRVFQQEHSTYHHGTYQVSDIEGAASSSLISEAVRNRMKGNSRHHARGRHGPYAFQNNISMAETNQDNEYQKQKSQLEKPRSQKNYHFSRVYHIQTEPVQSLHSQLEVDKIYNYNPNPESRQHRFVTQQIQVEDERIKKLEQELFENEETRLKQKQRQWNKERNQQSEAQLQSASEKKMEISRVGADGLRNKRSVGDISSMWHGDHHKIRLFPTNEIRRLNPTYLSAENYAGDKIYNKYYSPY